MICLIFSLFIVSKVGSQVGTIGSHIYLSCKKSIINLPGHFHLFRCSASDLFSYKNTYRIIHYLFLLFDIF